MPENPTHLNIVRAASLRGFESLVRDLGGDPAAILNSCGLKLGDLADPDRYLPYDHAALAIEQAARTLKVRDFGLRLSAGQDMNTLGLLALIMQSASSVREGMLLGTKYLYFHNPAEELGAITLTQALANSCNTAFAAAASTISPEQLHEAAGSLGVGIDYDAGFTANFGTVEPNNSAIDRAASMIGQGQITMSPLGMAAVAASVASGKTTIPWLVNGKQATSSAPALTTEEATQLQQMMAAVVTDGSGRSLAGLMTGAKTGTAEFGPVDAYKTHGWMIAWNDGVSVAAFVEEGVSGSQSAAPLITALFS